MKWLKWILVLFMVLAIVGFSAKTLIEWHMLPAADFENTTPPPAPDYDQEYFWVAHPNKLDSSDASPSNIDTTNDLKEKPVDIFFIHSTGYVGPGGWNSTMGPDNSEIQSVQYMLSSMASIYNGCCKVYAPHYREAHLASFVSEDTQSSFQALDLAYSDVEAAFDYFLEHFNNGRPFMIVSHSQGTAHALRLLETRIDAQALQSQLVAAYLIGYWLPTDKLQEFESISLCDTPDAIACIVSFDSYGEGGYLSGQPRHWYKSGWKLSENKSIACVNPISWRTNTNRASAQNHLGAMPVDFKRNFVHMLTNTNADHMFTELPDVHTKLTWAECDKTGALIVAEQHDNAFSNHWGAEDKSYHLLDFSLFYGNIRENAIARAHAYLNK